jgi:hypothetical protein
VDELNKKRLRNGEPLSYHGLDDDEVEDLVREAMESKGHTGRTLSWPGSNPATTFREVKWLPFGATGDKYRYVQTVVTTLGHRLYGFETYDEALLLYFEPQDQMDTPIRFNVYESRKHLVYLDRSRSELLKDDDVRVWATSEEDSPQVAHTLTPLLGATLTEVRSNPIGEVLLVFNEQELLLFEGGSSFVRGQVLEGPDVFTATVT